MPEGTLGYTVRNGQAAASGPNDAAELARLSLLEPLAYEREREAAATRLKVRVGVLDKLVEPLRAGRNQGQARAVSLADVEPWPEPVEGGVLLGRLAATVQRHVVLSPGAADAITLWIAHTWVTERFGHTPRLGIGSPAKRCGKSTLLEVLRATCRRPLKADNISASAVFRTVEALREEGGLTLLVDEADTFLGDNEELRGILNSGFERSGEVVRVVEIGGEFRPVRFATFCPVALAGIGALPATLADRCVPITLQRKATSESVTKLRAPGARAALHDAARHLARWAADRGPHLGLDPAVPEEMGDREGDISVPLLSIADDAGGDWPARARRALLHVYGLRNAAEGNAEAGALLLADIRTLFAGMSATRLASAEIVTKLAEMEQRPWPEWWSGKPITAPQLAAALAPFGVCPTTIRPSAGGSPVKGYHRDAFEEAWSRYLPPPAPSSTP